MFVKFIIYNFIKRMSYLAMSAAPYDNNNSENNDNNRLNQKKLSRNSTQNNSNSDLLINNEKVSQVLETIHNLHRNPSMHDEDDGGDLGDFNPMPPPMSAGVSRTMDKEDPMTKKSQPHMQSPPHMQSQSQIPKPSYSSSFENAENELNNYKVNYGNEQATSDYYKKYVPNYPQNYSNSSPYKEEYSKEDILLEKLNYMIHLLEDQQDERTNTVMEEVVLYSFLGIFIIYIADSFTRIGKYTR